MEKETKNPWERYYTWFELALVFQGSGRPWNWSLTFLHVQIQRKNYPLLVQTPKLRILFCTMIDGKGIKESMRKELHLIWVGLGLPGLRDLVQAGQILSCLNYGDCFPQWCMAKKSKNPWEMHYTWFELALVFQGTGRPWNKSMRNALHLIWAGLGLPGHRQALELKPWPSCMYRSSARIIPCWFRRLNWEYCFAQW